MTLSYINTAVNMVVGLILSSFLLQSLGDTEYGLYQTISSFSSYLVLLEFGTGTVMTRNMSVCINSKDTKDLKDAMNRNYSTVWIISLILSMLILAVSMVFYFCVGAIYSKTMTPEQIQYGRRILLFLFVYIIVSYLSQNFSGMLLAMEEYTFPKIVMLCRVVIRVGLLLTLLSMWKYSIIIAVVDMILSMVEFFVYYLYSKKRYHLKVSFRFFDKSVFKASVPLCLALLLQVLTNQANNNVDKFIIGVTMSVESVALYSIVQYIFTMFSSVATIPVSMFMPEVSQNMTKNLDRKAFTDTLIHPCRLSAIICGTILFAFFAVGKQFIAVLYGTSKTDAWLYSLIILVPMFVNMTDAVIINVLDIANKRLVRSLALLGTTIANIVLTIILINIIGIIGAVIATAVTLVIGNIVVINLYYHKKFGIKVLYLFREAYRGVLICQMIASAVSFFIARLITDPLWSFLIGGLTFIVISFSLMMVFGLNKSEKASIRRVFGRIVKH